ncbi:MAG: hypothetical protein ABR936_12105 [Bacteroidota bacterium]|jgi:hypothetical protein
MKNKLLNVIVIISFAGLLISCATTSQFSPGSGNKYRYTYKLVSPVKNSNLLFRDDSVIIQFKFDEAAIRFQLQNISGSNITVDWNRASIGISDRYFAVRHASNFYGDTIRSSSIIMPPLGYVRDVIIPRDNIYNAGGKWVELDLLPTTDHRSLLLQESIKKNVGKRVSLIFPMMFGSTEKNYRFDFQVDSVKRIAWKDYVPLKRVPAPPMPEHAVTALDNVTTAVITVGFLGFSAYVLSLKKNPPSE